MTAATIEEVIAELTKLGIDADQVPRPPQEGVAGVNVWTDFSTRAPVTTIWRRDGEGWIWGPSYQYGAYPEDDAATVAAKVSASLDSIEKLLQGQP